MEKSIDEVIDVSCKELAEWLAGLPAWETGPWVGGSKGYRGPTLLDEADVRLHLVRILGRHLDPEWLHQEVPTSTYLFPCRHPKAMAN